MLKQHTCHPTNLLWQKLCHCTC